MMTLLLGDSCKTPQGIAGECKIILDCAPAIDNIKRGIMPTICGFNHTQSIVCCTYTSHPITKKTVTTTITASKGTSGQRKPGEISKKSKLLSITLIYLYLDVLAKSESTAKNYTPDSTPTSKKTQSVEVNIDNPL